MGCLIRRRVSRAIADGRMGVATLATMKDAPVPCAQLGPVELLRGQHPRPRGA
ncbi:hypothetical protein [Luteibacter yeojuensis]